MFCFNHERQTPSSVVAACQSLHGMSGNNQPSLRPFVVCVKSSSLVFPTMHFNMLQVLSSPVSPLLSPNSNIANNRSSWITYYFNAAMTINNRGSGAGWLPSLAGPNIIFRAGLFPLWALGLISCRYYCWQPSKKEKVFQHFPEIITKSW